MCTKTSNPQTALAPAVRNVKSVWRHHWRGVSAAAVACIATSNTATSAVPNAPAPERLPTSSLPLSKPMVAPGVWRFCASGASRGRGDLRSHLLGGLDDDAALVQRLLDRSRLEPAVRVR